MSFAMLAPAWEYLSSGGMVMLPLFGMSLYMWILIISKWLDFYQDRKQELSYEKCLQGLHTGQALGASWQREIARILLRLEAFSEQNIKKRLLQRLKKKQEYILDRHISTILVLASAASLLGLLGTVLGMISTFEVISSFGTANSRAMASGVSEALVTTQTGLLVSVPGLVLGRMLRQRSEQIKDRLQGFCLKIAEFSENR